MTWQQNLPAGSRTPVTCELTAFEDGNGNLNNITHRWTGKSIYTLDANGNVNGFNTPSGGLLSVAPTYTWAQIQALASPFTGQQTICSDFGYVPFVYRAGYWQPVNPIVLQPSGGIPLVVPSSGSIGNNGALTGIASLPATITQCYMYFPANAIASGSAALWYYVVMASATAGTIYNNTLSGTFAALTGPITVPTAPVAFVTTGPGAYTQTSSEIPFVTYSIPANLMAPQSQLRFDYQASCINNANTKKISWYMSLGDFVQNNTIISASGGNFQFLLTNRGSQSNQTAQANNYAGYSAAAAVNATSYGNYNFSSAQLISITFILGTPATDWIVLDSYHMTLVPYL